MVQGEWMTCGWVGWTGESEDVVGGTVLGLECWVYNEVWCSHARVCPSPGGPSWVSWTELRSCLALSGG